MPREVAYAVCVGLGSVLIPRTWVSFSTNFGYAARNPEIWSVHPPVNEKMWKDRTTLLDLLNWLRVTVLPCWSGTLKSGAWSPISGI